MTVMLKDKTRPPTPPSLNSTKETYLSRYLHWVLPEQFLVGWRLERCWAPLPALPPPTQYKARLLAAFPADNTRLRAQVVPQLPVARRCRKDLMSCWVPGCPALSMCRGLAALPIACLERAKDLKTRLGILLHKPELGHRIRTSSKLQLGSRRRDSSREVLEWRESFDQLLKSKSGVTAFHTFLKTEFSEENLDFWLACEDFKKTRSKTKLASKANRIFEEFVQSEAPREVNIDHETREITRKNLSGATSACFNEAQAKTRTLMEKDSYPRFLKSASYQDMTKQVTSRGISKRSHT
ncbi:regulator of G-protein signaling 16-like isoform X1 [Strix uralensis]|uniref:regulator of G-protein signaling 16-like isoform X1 n=1 Tax=Strix uralensis TaxID=36305 RepID=UPI003DA6FBDC